MKQVTVRLPESMIGRMVLAVVAPVALIGVVALFALTVTRLPSDAAFRADGVVVSKGALEQRIRVLGALYGLRAPTDPAQADEFRRATAQTIALSTVLDNAIHDRNLAISDPQAQQLLAAFIDQGINPPGQAAFGQLLRDTGASEGDVLEELTRQAGNYVLYHQVTDSASASVSESDVRTYFDRHAAEMVQPEQRHLRNIVISTQDEADQLLGDIRNGQDFSAVAQQSSLDQKTRDGGGDLGALTADQLDGGYQRAAFAAPVGALFGPVQTRDGWNIGQVLEVHPAVPLAFEQIHDQLFTRLRTERAEQVWRAWVSSELARADVRYAPEFQPANPGAISTPGGSLAGVAGTGSSSAVPR
jgi:peptidyl-prolyl cis-trans isomerase C